MLRVTAIVAMLALAATTLAEAEVHRPAGKPAVRAGGGQFQARRPAVGGPRVGAPHVGGPHVGGPRVGGGPVGRFGYHGHFFNRVHLSPFVYPGGWGYRRWAVGAALPALFLAPAYYYSDWGAMGLTAPPPGFQWVRYGPDLLLVDTNTGQISDVIYGAFVEG